MPPWPLIISQDRSLSPQRPAIYQFDASYGYKLFDTKFAVSYGSGSTTYTREQAWLAFKENGKQLPIPGESPQPATVGGFGYNFAGWVLLNVRNDNPNSFKQWISSTHL